MKIERIFLKELYPILEKEDCNAYVDCYIPDPMYEMGTEMLQRKYPCMVICPGGGYARISERESEPIAMHFIAEGYRVFAVHYSVAPHGFPQALREVAGVMEMIHSNAEAWKIDVYKIALMGFSAGGHLAAQYANRYDCPEIRDLFPNSKPVNANILNYAVLTANPQYMHVRSISTFVGHEPTSLEEKGCSCEFLVTEKTPPTFLWHTAEDGVVPVENSMLYAMALRKFKIPFELHVYPHGPHGLGTVDALVNVEVNTCVKRAHKWIYEVKEWLDLQWDCYKEKAV